MTEEDRQQATEWLRKLPPVRDSLVRGIRFADETFVSDFASRDFSPGAMEQAWRTVADTYQVLSAQQLAPTRLTWVHDRCVLHCTRRNDGAILGVIVSRKQTDTDSEGLERLFGEFQISDER